MKFQCLYWNFHLIFKGYIESSIEISFCILKNQIQISNWILKFALKFQFGYWSFHWNFIVHIILNSKFTWNFNKVVVRIGISMKYMKHIQISMEFSIYNYVYIIFQRNFQYKLEISMEFQYPNWNFKGNFNITIENSMTI